MRAQLFVFITINLKNMMKRFITLCVAVCALLSVDVAQAAKVLKLASFNIVVSNHETENGWNVRKGAIVNFFKQEAPDIVGLQEATYMEIEYLLSQLPDYAYYGVSRDTGKAGDRGEYTAIIYNKQSVELLDKGEFCETATTEKPSRSWNDEVKTPIEPHPGAMKYNRVCTWGLFRHKASKKEFYHFNTHLEFGYHANELLGQTAREKGVELIVERMKQMVGEKCVLLSGDMNQVTGNRCFNPIFEWGMKDARIESKHVLSEENRNSVTWNGFNFNSNSASNIEKEEKSKGPGNFHMIDYIFYKGCKVLEYRTVRDKIYGGEPVVEGIPYMSDHYPIMVQLKL